MRARGNNRLGRLAVALIALAAGTAAAAAPRPVVLELFTSNACSSCPPAHRLLSRLRNAPPVADVDLILLSQHVDYWNNLGWTDPYSDARFTRRQRRYARQVFGANRVYTPQLVVDGTREMVGSRRGQVVAAIRRAADAARLPVAVDVARDSGDRFEVGVRVDGRTPAGSSRVWVALTQDDVVTHVGGGENGGRTLREDGVVRVLIPAKRIGGDAGASRYSAQLNPPKGVPLSKLSVVAFVQRKPLGAIVGASRQPLAELAGTGVSSAHRSSVAVATR